MQINTFIGRGDLDEAIEEAQEAAQGLLSNLNPAELVEIKTQTIIDRWTDDGLNRTRCFHIITVIYR